MHQRLRGVSDNVRSKQEGWMQGFRSLFGAMLQKVKAAKIHYTESHSLLEGQASGLE